ncbi:MAG: GreA/GreB family elongation factor, partial [Patescibacteria group bacterium]|jgi:transcription elongation GreA/GreB family factor
VTITREGKNVTYTVLGPTETNPEKGIISYQSPLGKALMGRRAGDTVHFEQGKTHTQYTVITIR